MNVELITVDNFYNNPEELRETALSLDFNVVGNFPGKRTQPCINSSVKQVIQNLIRPMGGEVTHWGDDYYTGSFQLTTKNDKSWIHCDNFNTWAGVCYLTPDAPFSAGTGLFKHKESGAFRRPVNQPELEAKLNSEGADPSKWNLTDVLSNKFNRLILYRGDLYHCSLDYFGEDRFTGRLFQTFFFNSVH